MEVRQLDPTDKRDVRRFVRLEQELYADAPLAVVEPLSDVRKRVTGRSAYSPPMDVSLWLAEGSGRAVARCAGVIHRDWQAAHDDTRGGIGWLAAAPGVDLAELLAPAEAWLADRDATAALAPFNGTALIGSGVLTDRFDESPMFPMPWHPPHLVQQLEAAGYGRRYPMWSYWVDFADERYRRARDSALRDAACTVRPIDKKRWKDELELLRVLHNDGMSGEWEMHPYTRAEWNETLGPSKPIQDARMMLVAEVDGEPAGSVFGFGDITPLVRSFRGRIGPLQIVRMLLQGRRWDRAGLLSISVLERFRGRGIGRTLAAQFFANVEAMGSPGSFYYLVNEHNRQSRGLAESFGGEGGPLYHVLEKPL